MREQEQEVPKYVVQEKSLIGNEMYEAGAVVAYDGLPAENLEPTCDLGRKRRQEYLDSNAERVKAMTAQFSESTVGDPSKFMAAFAEQMKKDNEARDEKLAVMVGTAVAQAFAAAMAHAKAEAAVFVAPPTEQTSEPKGKAKDKTGDSLV